MILAAVVVPVYKSIVSEFERISLTQCAATLNDYPVIFVGPANVDYAVYLDIIPTAKIEYFDSSFFQSTTTYNDLMLSINFYERFILYKYVLIYQTDAFVFKDELRDWCNDKYDYIGAPWFTNFRKVNVGSEQPWKVGNGGFSLRKVKSFIDILSRNSIVNNHLEVIEQYWNLSTQDKMTQFPKVVLTLLGFSNRSREFIKNFELNEDHFWGLYAHKICTKFKVAPINEAVKFAFECSPKALYELNGDTLPFGCHAWGKYEIDFWRPHIEKFGYKL